MLKVCRIQKYDPAVKVAPFQFITLVERVEVDEPPRPFDDGGTEFYHRLAAACRDHGYTMRFYSMSSEEGIDFDITVEGELESELISPLERIEEALWQKIASLI